MPFKGLENTPMQHYLSMSKMKDLGTWGSELEIHAFASLCNTTVHVYCNCGSGHYKWLPYKPLAGNQSDDQSVYLLNKYGHFEPVLDVQEEFYSRTPYLRIGDSLERRFQNFVSQEMLDSPLVNSASDELKLRAVEDINPPHVYIKSTLMNTVHLASSRLTQTYSICCVVGVTLSGICSLVK